jgi:hypothetical protein
MSTIDESSVAMKMPSVVLESAVHLYRSGRSSPGGPVVVWGPVVTAMDAPRS